MVGSILESARRYRPRYPVFAALVGAAFFSTFLGAVGVSPAVAQEAGDGFVDGEVVVKLDLAQLGPSPDCRAVVDRIGSQNSAAVEDTLIGNARVACIYLLKLQEGSDTEKQAEDIASDQRVAYAEPNFTTDAPEGNPRHRGYPGGTPSPAADPAPYTTQYAVDALGLSCADGVSRGGNSVVAVLDTGVQADHPELAGSLTTARYDFVDDDAVPEDAGNGQDEDGDTLVDETVGHGTHVAGIVHLTAPEAEIMPLRVLDSDGTGNVFLVAEAVEYAINNGADVVNMSLGSSRESDLIRDVADDLDAVEDDDDDDDDDGGRALANVPPEGAVVVASAGNENAETARYPAAEPGVLGVASVDESEIRSEFSNYGGWVSVAAPGEEIYSAFPPSRYASWDGTSMAVPFVAGQAALIRSIRPKIPSTGPQGQPSVNEFVTSTARPLDTKNPDYSGKLGSGHADACASALKANTAPTVSQMRPAPGSKTRDRTPTLAAAVSDAQTDLTKSNVTLYLDGRKIDTFSYNTGTDRLTRASSRLSYGSHKVRITARDAQGLDATRTWGFRVVR